MQALQLAHKRSSLQLRSALRFPLAIKEGEAMNNEEILRRLRLLISLFDDNEEEESIAHFKKAILGKPHQDEVNDPLALFDFLKTAIVDAFLNFEVCGMELLDYENGFEKSTEKCEKLSRENAWLKKQLLKRDK